MASILDTEVSCFQNYNTPDNPVTINLMTWLSSTKYQSMVETIRHEPDKDKRFFMKASLPAITPSGIFSRRESKSLVKHSGLIAFDVDYAQNKHIGNYKELKKEIIKISNIAYLGLSVSGTGFWGLIPIAFPEKHLQHFFALEIAFKKLGIVIDPSCKDIGRLRGYSFDAEMYFNRDARIFTAKHTPLKTRMPYFKQLGDTDQAKVEQCLSQLSVDITNEYANWFELGCALANTFGECGRPYFHKISHLYHSYSERETDKQFDKCLKGYRKITLGTLFHRFQAIGIKPETNYQKQRDR